MIVALEKLETYAVEAIDGYLGRISDFLFDDVKWNVKWIVVDPSCSNSGATLLHPSSIDHVNHDDRILYFKLTQAQVAASPPLDKDRPVSQQLEAQFADDYAVDFPINAMAYPISAPPLFSADEAHPSVDPVNASAHLRSRNEVAGYRLHATDGEIGHVQDILIDDSDWCVRYLVVDTRNWLPGAHVLISPATVRQIEFADREIRIGADRATVNSSPRLESLGQH